MPQVTMITLHPEDKSLFRKLVDSVLKIAHSKTVINWEQRRYEIARDLYAHFEMDAKMAVENADLLIEELKKPKTDGEDSATA